MKFSIATNDAYQCVLDAFLKSGWQLEKLFLSPDNHLYSNQQVIARALELGAAIQYSPISSHDLAEMHTCGCDVLIVACYNWKIPPWHDHIRYAVNFHPSPLPEARGPYPLVRAILEERSSWAVTCHQISDEFDRGNIIDTEHFHLDPDDCHEILRIKIQMVASRLAERIALQLDFLWQKAAPQEAGSYWPRWSEQDRFIDFTQPVGNIMRQIRAFGDMECTASLNDVTIFVHRAKGWTESHSASPGAVVSANNFSLLVAACDGFIAITEWSLNAPATIISNLRH